METLPSMTKDLSPWAGAAPYDIEPLYSVKLLDEIKDDAPIVAKDDIRMRIARMEAAMREMPQIDCPLKHTFTTGVYMREIFIPAGSCVVGKIHRHAHVNFISSGHVTVVTEHGGTEELHGPCTMVSKAGTKRALYAHTDTVWTTIHANPNEETDLDKLESDIIAKDYAELECQSAFALNIIP